jgi:hypothetical protein
MIEVNQEKPVIESTPRRIKEKRESALRVHDKTKPHDIDVKKMYSQWLYDYFSKFPLIKSEAKEKEFIRTYLTKRLGKIAQQQTIK